MFDLFPQEIQLLENYDFFTTHHLMNKKIEN